ncbi:MAG: NrpR regulatory domain-containing protein [bacterium]|jgi:repressor of nif and glnA expression
MSRKEKTQLAILKTLSEASAPMGAARIRSVMLAQGLDVQPRTIRFHLLQLDQQGLSQIVTRRSGRAITRLGREEMSRANVFEKVGVVSSRVDNLAYQMSFRPSRPEGSVVVNVSLIYPEHLNRALNEMKLVFRQNLAIGSRIVVAQAGELIANTVVPENYVAIGTVCSVSISGILMHEGIPVMSRFGGLLEMRNRMPVRFVELIEYQGSTLDPLEVFIQANMTHVRDVVLTGTGILCAGFREVPSVAQEDVRRLEKKLRTLGLGGIVDLGKPNQPLLGVPVSEGHIGMIVYGGLNPIAALQESGIPVKIKSLAGQEDFASFRTIEEHQRRLR